MMRKISIKHKIAIIQYIDTILCKNIHQEYYLAFWKMMEKSFVQWNLSMVESLYPEINDSPPIDEGGNHKFRSIVDCTN